VIARGDDWIVLVDAASASQVVASTLAVLVAQVGAIVRSRVLSLVGGDLLPDLVHLAGYLVCHLTIALSCRDGSRVFAEPKSNSLIAERSGQEGRLGHTREKLLGVNNKRVRVGASP